MRQSSPIDDEIVVKIDGVSHQYKSKLALDNVSLTLKKGSTIALIGPDGVGKSTLLSLISGSKKLQTGEMSVLGYDVQKKQDRSLLSNKLAFMPQGLGKNLYFSLSIWENINFFAGLFGVTGKEKIHRINQLLKATDLYDFRERPAGKLSGGMKQKLSLCCSLVHDPDLLILDEPTTGVDPLSRKQFWKLIDNIRQELSDMTVLVATAYIEEAEQFDYLLAMDDGKLICNDHTQKVLKNTDSKTVEEAYVKLLPEHKRAEIDFQLIPFEPIENTPPVIEAYHLTKKFGEFTAVNDVSFIIPKGEIFGFLGSNGCGKSTTMKMLTGLLQASSGEAKLLGKPVDATDIQIRMKIGYMSQSFSLYEEMTIKANLILHARLYGMTEEKIKSSIDSILEQFDLVETQDMIPKELSLGIRQRLQLAAACMHSPDILILDEPTSGVDPVARDKFWTYLLKLSREKKVTIFVSTHFMNEAARCDRISFMHAGKVLAMGTPTELQENINAPNLQEAFISYLENSPEHQKHKKEEENKAFFQKTDENLSKKSPILNYFSTIMCFIRREAIELKNDNVRLFFAFLGPLALIITTMLCLSFDIENVDFFVLDQDNSFQSRNLVEHLSGSSLFHYAGDLSSTHEIEPSLVRSQAYMVLDIPKNFSKNLLTGETAQVSFYIDGAQPFNGSAISQYAAGIIFDYNQTLAKMSPDPTQIVLPELVEPRFTYNQEFRTVYSMAPGILMLALILIPTMLTTLGVVREKESGSIINLYTSPVQVFQYLIGKIIPYILLSLLSCIMLILICVFLLNIPIKGSWTGLIIGSILFIMATSSLGMVVSCFVNNQIAGLFLAAIISLIPAANFSGLVYPISTLSGASYWIGTLFPASWFQLISLGAFTKGLGIQSFLPMYGVLIVFSLFFMTISCFSLKKQEK